MTSDLTQQIRAKLDEMRNNAQRRGIDADEEHDERLWRLSGDTELAASALLAVLELHPAKPGWDGTPNCVPCGPQLGVQPWPCPTVRAVAREPGIEADDA